MEYILMTKSAQTESETSEKSMKPLSKMLIKNEKLSEETAEQCYHTAAFEILIENSAKNHDDDPILDANLVF